MGTNEERVALTLRALAELQLAFPRSLSKAELEYYAHKLRDVPPDVLTATISVLVDECRFLPTIAEIKAKATTVYNQVNGQQALTAGDAWDIVMKTVSHWGFDRGLDKMPPEVRRAAEGVGWHDICFGDTSQRSTRRAHFLRIWEEQQSRDREAVRIGRVIDAQPRLAAQRMKSLSGSLERIKQLAEKEMTKQ